MAATGYERRQKGVAEEFYRPWGGWFPHPELDNYAPPRPRGERIADAMLQAKLGALRLPAAYQYTIPDGIPLALLRTDLGFLSADPSLVAQVKARSFTAEIASQSEKPADGVVVFVWRLARFFAGIAPVPVTAFWDLEDTIEQTTGIRGGATEEVIAVLADRAREVAAALGDPLTAAARWGKSCGIL